MSLKFEDLKAIRDSRGLTPRQKHCLMAIYSRGDEHTASVATLTADMGYAPGSVSFTRTILKELRDKGVINVVERRGESSEISINTRALQALVPPKTTPPPRSRGTARRRGPHLHTVEDPSSIQEPKENPKENMKEKEHASAGAAALSPEAKKAKTKKMTDSLIAEKRERSVVKGGEQNATPPSYSRGTPDGPIDYAELAGQDKSIKFYYDKHMAIEGMKPKAAYKLACRKAGKEVKA